MSASPDAAAALPPAPQLDAHSGALARPALLAAIAAAIGDAKRYRTSFGLLLVGIDHLARINDAFGFDVADEVIASVAQRIRATLRGGDCIGRFSGNKFGVLLANCTTEEMHAAAERFLRAVRSEIIPTRLGPVAATVSIGGIGVPRHARSVEEAVNRAQEALDRAKRLRDGAFAVWQPDHARDAQRRVNIRVTDEIVTALNERRIAIAFEPVVDIATRRPAFHECLVRMRQGDGSLLLAPDIVPVAERLGLIRLIDHRVLELAVAELAAAPDARLSFNISPDTLLDPDWLAGFDSLMRTHPGAGERLIVEVTETVAIRDGEGVGGVIARLKDFGCRIALDDFGAGYTSFRNLRRLGFDILKIDGGFVQGLAQSPDDRAFVQTLIELARRLRIVTVAEWVQDEESAAMLAAWGCDYMQGRLTGLAVEARADCIAEPPARSGAR